MGSPWFNEFQMDAMREAEAEAAVIRPRREVKAVCMHGVVTKVYHNCKLVVFKCCLCEKFLESLR